MARKKSPNPQPKGQQPHKGRKNFLKQSSLLTALAVTPAA
jgi:hypothetical protein